MGHYMTPLQQQGKNTEVKFPVLDASIIPMVWLKSHIGSPKFVIEYTKDDETELHNIADTGSDYEKRIARDILKFLQFQDSIMLDMELSGGSGKLFYNMFCDILPQKATFGDGMYEVTHSHVTIKAGQ